MQSDKSYILCMEQKKLLKNYITIYTEFNKGAIQK